MILFFHAPLFGGEQFYAGDTYRYFYPLKKMAAEAVRAGRAPVWNPLVHSGMPLHAAMQAAIFYPFSVLFYLFPYDFAYKWYVALHVFLAAAGTYALLRRWRLRSVAAAFGAITFAFSGYVISFIDGLNIFSSIVWLPIVFLFFERAVEKPRLSRVMLAALAVAAQTLAGDPVSGYYTFLICGAYWMLLIVTSSFAGRPRPETIARIAVLPAVAVLSLLLTYAQVGPSQELALYSTRAGAISYAGATGYSLEPLRLLTLAAPYLFGNPMENLQDWGLLFSLHFPLERTLYLGILPLALIPVSLFAFRERRVQFFAVVLILSALLALGKYTPLYGIAHSLLPMFDKFRYPVKAFFAATFAAAVLGGYGLHYLVEQEGRAAQRLWPRARVFLRYYSGVLLVGVPLLLIAFLCDRFLFHVSDGIFLRASAGPPEVTQRFIPYMKGELLRASLLLLIAGALILLRYKKLLPSRLFRLLAIGFLLADILPVAYRAMDTAPESFYSPPRLDPVLRADSSFFRLYRTPLDLEQNIVGLGLKTPTDYYLWNREILSPNFGTLFGYAYTDGYESANLLWHNRFIRFVEDAPPLLRPRLLGLLNLKYLFAAHPVNNPDLRLKIELDGNVFLYENLRCLPRAYFAPISITAANETIALQVLASNMFDPTQAVVLVDKGGPGSLNPQRGMDAFAVEVPQGFGLTSMNVEASQEEAAAVSGPAEPAPAMKEGSAPVDIMQYSPNRIEMKVDAPFAGHLVLCDSYYPKWKARVNGVETPILRANSTVRAVTVPAGRSTVEFVYDTRSFKNAALVSLAAVFLCIGLAAFDVLKRKRS